MHRVAALKVLLKQLTVTEPAAEYGISTRQLHRLLPRVRADGIDAIEPRSRPPRSNSAATPDAVRDRIVELRRQFAANGGDTGPVTIAWHLEREGHPPPTSTLRRILHAAGLVTPEPRQRPK